MRAVLLLVGFAVASGCGPSDLQRTQAKADDERRAFRINACLELARANYLDPAPCFDGGAPGGPIDASADAPPDAPPASSTRYGRCSGAADCSASETCRPLITGGASACLARCTVNADCPRAPEGAASPPTCSQDGWCFLTCSPALACPSALRCEMLSPSVGYCR